MDIIYQTTNYLKQSEERHILCKTRAIICGHPEWENACLSCGEQISQIHNYCLPCSILKGEIKNG